VFLNDCGGHSTDFSLFNCFELCCSNKKGCCTAVCPRKSDFAERLNEVGGFGWSDVREVHQRDVALPNYIPMIHHGSRRSEPLTYPIVALDTYSVLRLKQGRYTTVVQNGVALRTHFRLAPDTQIILRGTAPDGPLEMYWEYRDVENAAEQLRKLDILAVIGPNFSHFLNVPRTDNLFNRKRQLLCLSELSAAGHHTIPHLNAVRPGDWQFWFEFLKANSTIRHVAMEFQTGNKNRAEGCKHLSRLADLTIKLGRPLHPLLIGGRQFLWYAATRFPSLTVIDSTPFMKAMNRQSLVVDDGELDWEDVFTLERQPLDHVLGFNVSQYSALTSHEAERARTWHKAT
jgi:hypothetical protein